MANKNNAVINAVTISLDDIQDEMGGVVVNSQKTEKVAHPTIPVKVPQKGSLTEKNFPGVGKMITKVNENLEAITAIVREISGGKKDNYDDQQMHLAVINSALVLSLPGFLELQNQYREMQKAKKAK